MDRSDLWFHVFRKNRRTHPKAATCADCQAPGRRFQGTRVIVAGLDMDYLGRPFGQMPELLAKAEYITKLHAICMQCWNMANYSYRKGGSSVQVELGNQDLYEPRCRYCFEKGDLLK